MAHKETGQVQDLLEMSTKYRDTIASDLEALVTEASEGEFAALISFAIAFPEGFMALVDTYDVKRYRDRVFSSNISLFRLPFTINTWIMIFFFIIIVYFLNTSRLIEQKAECVAGAEGTAAAAAAATTATVI